jgi:hypothetical protein
MVIIFFTVTSTLSSFSGYGDLHPVTKGQQIFAMFFVTVGIMIIGGVVLGVVMQVLFAAFQNSLNSSRKRAQNQFLNKIRMKRSNGSINGDSQQHENFNASNDKDDSNASNSSSIRIWSTLHNLGLAALIFVPGIIIGHFEEWDFHEAIYYSVITATTVGYGDLSPKNTWTRFAACFYLPVCVTVMGSVFSKVTSSYMDKKTREAEEEFLQRKLTREDIDKMDFGGDGRVNPEEFLIFMLVNMGKVDAESIQQIQSLFQTLDKDGNGFLDAQDLLLMSYDEDRDRDGNGNGNENLDEDNNKRKNQSSNV